MYPLSRCSVRRVYIYRDSDVQVCSVSCRVYCCPNVRHHCRRGAAYAHSPAPNRSIQRRRPIEARIVERPAGAGADVTQTSGAGRERDGRAVPNTDAAANQCCGTANGPDGSHHPLRANRSRDTRAARNVDTPLGGYDT